MTFSESVRTCLREKFATFSGRASRSEYWWFVLAFFLTLLVFVFVLGGLAVAIIAASGGGFGAGTIILIVIATIMYLALLVPFIAVTIRRYHDRNASGWWYAGIFVFGLLPNVFPNVIALGIISAILGIGSLIFCCLKGTQGPNKYGPDPLGGGEEEIFS